MAQAKEAINNASSGNDSDRILQILNANNSKRFIKRILQPFGAPVAIDDEDPSRVMTHKMSWGDSDGKYYVFPSVMEDLKTGELVNYGKDAFIEALRRRDFIKFDNPEDADWFSRNYKTYWEDIGYNPQWDRALRKMDEKK